MAIILIHLESTHQYITNQSKCKRRKTTLTDSLLIKRGGAPPRRGRVCKKDLTPTNNKDILNIYFEKGGTQHGLWWLQKALSGRKKVINKGV